jgi:FKBP-type peptidyl-prolyl cis-trans isomerase
MWVKSIVIVLLASLISSCSEPKTNKQESPVDWNSRKSSRLHEGLSQKEADDIRLFLEMRPEWEMEETGSGLRIWIYEEGDGSIPEPNDVAEIEYEISLLSGELCYKTADDEYEEVRVDRSDIETGIQEALKLMQVGDRAKLIVPSHIGHGLLGDLDKIPPLRSLVIDLKLIGIKNK